MEKSLCKSISRRDFLRGLFAIALWPLARCFSPVVNDLSRQSKIATIEVSGPVKGAMIEKVNTVEDIAGQAWGFPLAFPAFFVQDEHEKHKKYLPLIMRG